MSLPLNNESEDYLFYKTLNEDVQLISNSYGKFDLNFSNGDYVNVTGKDSLYNAIIIAIMTRFQELGFIELYDEFGCKIHELIKANQLERVEYDMELFVEDSLENMRRINEINEIKITSSESQYNIYFNVTSIDDEIVSGEVSL